MGYKVQTFELEGGGKVAVEVQVRRDEEERIATLGRDVVEDTGKKFSAALVGVEQATREILHGFAASLSPDTLELSFGLKFSANAGVVLTSASAEATLTLKATWKPEVGKKGE